MRKIFTLLSITFFTYSFLMLFYLFQSWSIAFIDYLYKISIFTPLMMNMISVLFASLGVKGMTQKTIIYLNILILVVFGMFYLFAMYGFQDP